MKIMVETMPSNLQKFTSMTKYEFSDPIKVCTWLISGGSCYEKSNGNHGQTAKERAGAEK